MATPDGVLDFIRETQKDFIEEEIVVDGQNVPNDIDQTICSGCSQLNLIRIKAHSTQIPKLLVLMNSFIHMSTSAYCLRNYKMTGQFW